MIRKTLRLRVLLSQEFREFCEMVVAQSEILWRTVIMSVFDAEMLLHGISRMVRIFR